MMLSRRGSIPSRAVSELPPPGGPAYWVWEARFSQITGRYVQRSICNLTLLCRYHHAHFLQKGWTCRMNPDGLPEWTPPRWIDQNQRPHTNTRIQRLNTQ